MQLFKKDIFSASNPLFHKLSDADQNELAATIRIFYPDLPIKKIHRIGALELNSNNWKIESGDAVYILKRADIGKYETLSAQAAWTSQLQKNNFPALQFLENKNKELIGKDEKYAYCITVFENGNYFGSSKNEWASLLLHLKKLYSYSLQNNSSSKIPARDFFTLEEDRLVTELNKNPVLTDISKETVLYACDEYEKAKSLFRSKESNWNKAVFHVDVHPHNLIFENSRLVLLTDFEAFQQTTAEISLGFGLYKCMRQLLTLAADDAETQALAATFKQEFNAAFPGHDLAALLNYGSMDVLKRILYIFAELHANGGSKWLFILQTQLNALEEIKELNRLLS